MLDLRLIRKDPDAVRTALARRGGDVADRIDRVLALDERRRAILPELEGLRAQQNDANQAIARAKQEGGDADAAIATMREVAGRAKALQEELGQVEADLEPQLASLPNLPDPTAAPEDTVVREVGEPYTPAFAAKDHLELAGERIDMERGARLSGARFAYLRGELVFLEFALVRWALEKLRGF